MTDRDFILAPQTVTVQVALEPVLNVLTTLMLLSDSDNLSGFSEWVLETSCNLTAEQQRIHTILHAGLFDGMYAALTPSRSSSRFDVYLDHLATMEPVAVRDHTMAWMENKKGSPGREALLADSAVYMDFLAQVYAAKDKELCFTEGDMREAHRYLNDPPAMQDLLVSFMRSLWETALADEWERSRPMLEEAVKAFQEVDLSGLTALEAVRVVTRRDMTDHWDDHLATFKRLIFVPSAHIGPYITSHEYGDLIWIVFGARMPEGSRTHSPALNRSELLVQLNALADDIRLRILELVIEHGELCAQDIITQLDLSQSSASRHLRQLTATGYLTERRREVAKCYSLNSDRAENVLHALRDFLHGK